MAVCNFEIPFTGNPEGWIGKARSAVESQGGQFQGDNQSGEFSVTILGNTITGGYTISANVMKVRVDEKPFFVPCSTIENFLRNKAN